MRGLARAALASIAVVAVVGVGVLYTATPARSEGLGAGTPLTVHLLCVQTSIPCDGDTVAGGLVGKAVFTLGGLSDDHPSMPGGSPVVWLKITDLGKVAYPTAFWAVYLTTDTHPERTRIYSFNMPDFWYRGDRGHELFETYIGLGDFGYDYADIFESGLTIEIAAELDDGQSFVPIGTIDPLFVSGTSPAPEP